MKDIAFRFVLLDPPRLLSVGEGAKALLGFTRQDFLKAKVLLNHRVHPGDAPLLDSIFSPHLGHKQGSFNIRLRHADGKIRCIKGTFKKNRAPTGETTLELRLADARDVKQAGDAILVASFKSLIEDTSDYIYVKNRNHVILAASRTLPNLIESAGDRTTLLGTTDYDNHPEATADIYYALEEKVFAEGKRANLIHQVPLQDGTLRWIDNRKYPINGPDGEIIGIFGVAPNITDYIETQNKLQQSEESLREAQAIAGLGNYELDLQAKVWKTSAELDALLGIGPEYDRRLEGWLPLVHPEDRQELAEDLNQYMLSLGEPFDKEYRIVRHTDGALRWVHTRGRLEFDAAGKPRVLRGTIQDITQRKQSEASLRENRELLRLFIEHAPVALAMFDREMRYIAVSRRWLEVHGLTGRDLIGQSHYAVFPAIPTEWKEEHRRALAGETIEAGEGMLTKSDGSLQWVRREMRPWFTGNGQIGGIILFSEDVTERKRAEMAVRESREQLQLFVEHAPVALAMFDREMRYIAVSRRWAEDHSIDKQAIIGRSHYEINQNVPERWRETHRRGLAGESQRVEEDINPRPDGTEQWIRWQIIPWRADDGSVGGIVMFYEDITERKLAEAALRESRELLQLFIDRAPAALAMFDREMRYIAVSRRWLEDYDLEREQIIGRSHYEVVPEVPERWREAHRRGLAGETLKADEDSFERADGAVQWIRWEVVPWRVSDGSVGGIVLFAEDITTHKEIEQRLHLASMVFTGAREGITITDAQGTILDVNDAFTRITGYTRDEVLGKNPRLLKSGLQSREFYENMWSALLHEGHWSGEIWNRAKNGDIYPESLAINAINDASGKAAHYIALFSDISEIKEHAQQLEHIAHFDALTGLPNRVLFADRLRQAMAQSHRSNYSLAVIHFDLDGFKAVNDRYGHSIGDGLLTAMAFRMKHALRDGDTLARLGGDEFAAVMLELDDTEAVVPAMQRLLSAASEEAQIGEVALRVSASAGVTFYPQAKDVDADVLLRQAGQAMYQAKLAGGNRYCEFDPGEDLIARSRHENLEHIRQALAARQFVLHFQPEVNMRTGKIVSAEALIRWQHPERGLLPPGMFLPVIEDHPLLIELGDWVVESALLQMESWHEQGFDLPVSVNVSAIELQQPEFADRLRARLAAHPGIKPENLALEVVETSALQDITLTSHVLTACREIGVSLALDDFGIGYSSLTYLRRLPANLLKIDQSFVRNMDEEPENLTILEGVIGLAAAFRRNVVAEGVETVDHGLMLLQMGCELAQGYGIARPMPGDELPAWAATWHPDPRWADVPPVHESNRPVLYACVEHRAWLSAFEACLQGRRTAPPSLDAGHCRVGAWLNAEKQSARGTLASIQAIESLHRELHLLASEIFKSQAEGRNPEGLARLQQLHYLHDKCLSRLRSFTRVAPARGNRKSRVSAAHKRS